MLVVSSEIADRTAGKMEDPDIILDALNDFEKKGGKDIPQTLEELLCDIAKTGETKFPWSKLKRLFICKLEKVIQDFVETNPHEDIPILPNVENVEYDDMKKRLIRALESFNSAPFTIQRLCELITEPTKYYNRSDKFMRGIEKNVLVVTTVPPFARHLTPEHRTNGSAMVNGILSDNAAPTHVGSVSSTQTQLDSCDSHSDNDTDKTDSDDNVTVHEEAEAMEVSYDSLPVSTGVETSGQEDMKNNDNETAEDSSEAVESSEQETQESEASTEERPVVDSDKVENMQVSSSEAEAESKDTEESIEPCNKSDESSAIVSTTVLEETTPPKTEPQDTDKSSEVSEVEKDDDGDEPDPKRPRYDATESETTTTTATTTTTITTTDTHNQSEDTAEPDDQSEEQVEDKAPDSQSGAQEGDRVTGDQENEDSDVSDNVECSSKDDDGAICQSDEVIETDKSKTIDDGAEVAIKDNTECENTDDSGDKIHPCGGEPTDLKSSENEGSQDDSKRTVPPNEKGDCPVLETEPMDQS